MSVDPYIEHTDTGSYDDVRMGRFQDNETTVGVVASNSEVGDLENANDAVHDQLPSLEEYKTNMVKSSPSGGAMNNRTFSEDDEEILENGAHDSYVQDQLPTVDEYKASSFTGGDKSFGALYYFAVFVGLVVLTAVIVVPIVLTQDNRRPVTSATASDAAQAPVSVPTLPPLVRQSAVIEHLAAVGVSSEEAMTTPDTPQFNAVEWMASDELQLPVPTEESSFSRFVERYVLAVLYFSTRGDSWQYKVNFLSGADHCDWYGDFLTQNGRGIRIGVSSCATIDASSTDRFVTALSLPSNKLDGTLPSEISFLRRVRSIFAPFNLQLTGHLSIGLHNLSFLEDVSFQYCGLSGSIPEQLGSLSSLTSLGLANNRLEGSIPSDFFSLTSLEVLFLDDNLIEGNIEDFAAFNKMKALYIEDNFLTGQFTSAMVTNWSNSIIELDISSNMINSTLPEALFAMPNLSILDLHGNSFHGSIPAVSSPTDTTPLLFLALHDNELTGVIPESISNLSRLEHLDVAKNKLQAPLPESLGELMGLVYLFTGSNDFSRQMMPEWLWSLTNLEELSMKDSSLTGEIPSEIGTLTRLQLLDLDSNELEGTIPSEMGNIASLRFLLLNRNNLSGPIPSSFASLTRLTLVLLDHNEINGTADVLCMDDNLNIEHFVSDCEGPNPVIECSCCDLCCNRSNATCNQLSWNANLNPMWEFGYYRNSFAFSIDSIIAGTGN